MDMDAPSFCLRDKWPQWTQRKPTLGVESRFFFECSSITKTSRRSERTKQCRLFSSLASSGMARRTGCRGGGWFPDLIFATLRARGTESSSFCFFHLVCSFSQATSAIDSVRSPKRFSALVTVGVRRRLGGVQTSGPLVFWFSFRMAIRIVAASCSSVVGMYMPGGNEILSSGNPCLLLEASPLAELGLKRGLMRAGILQGGGGALQSRRSSAVTLGVSKVRRLLALKGAKQTSDMGGTVQFLSIAKKEKFPCTFGSGKQGTLESEELDVDVMERESSVSLSEHNDTRFGSRVLLN